MHKPHPSQLATIHKLKKALGMEDEEYRAMLRDNWHVDSSKALYPAQADELIQALRRELPTPVHNAGKMKYEHLGHRPGKATPRQLRYIEGMWADVSIYRDQAGRDKALKEFLHNRFQIGDLLWIEEQDVQRVIKALKEMLRQKVAAERKAAKARKAVGT